MLLCYGATIDLHISTAYAHQLCTQ